MTASGGGAATFSVILATSVAIRSPQRSSSLDAGRNPVFPSADAVFLDATSAQRLGLLFFFRGRANFNFQECPLRQRPHSFVASGPDLGARLQAALDFD